MKLDQNSTKLVSKILDRNIINNIPEDFFEYINNLIINADYYEEVPLPEDFDNIIINYKYKEFEELKNYLSQQENEDLSDIDSFAEIFGDIFMERYIYFFKKNSKYLMRRIQTPQEYGIWSQVNIQDAPNKHYVAFDINDFLPKLANGVVDINKLNETEKANQNIASYFSALSHAPLAKVLFLEQFEAITSKGFLTMDNVYGDEMKELMHELSILIIHFLSRRVYSYIKEGIEKDSACINVVGYFEQMIFPPNHKFPSDMSELEVKIRDTISEAITNTMPQLNRNSRDRITLDLIETILYLIKIGEFIPLYFYKFEFREGSILDLEDYNAHFVADVYTIEKGNQVSPDIFESYGLIIDDQIMADIIRKSIVSKSLFEKFVSYNLI